mmetsp:Transcript_88146/g.247965  ORF Transcript_88146/g.247965 Transcript_88146/m.247965 type:complete len:257 (+) Transcript_88146:729-1499(+)
MKSPRSCAPHDKASWAQNGRMDVNAPMPICAIAVAAMYHVSSGVCANSVATSLNSCKGLFVPLCVFWMAVHSTGRYSGRNAAMYRMLAALSSAAKTNGALCPRRAANSPPRTGPTIIATPTMVNCLPKATERLSWDVASAMQLCPKAPCESEKHPNKTCTTLRRDNECELARSVCSQQKATAHKIKAGRRPAWSDQAAIIGVAKNSATLLNAAILPKAAAEAAASRPDSMASSLKRKLSAGSLETQKAMANNNVAK